MNPIFKLAQDLKNAEGVSIAAIIKQIEALKKVDSMTAKELEKHVKALVALKKAVDDIPLTEEVTKLKEAISAATERVTASLESKITTTKAELSKDIKATETKLRKEIENRIPDIVTVTEKVTEVAKALDDAEIRKVLDKAIEPEFVKKVRDVIEGFEGEERMDATKLKNLPKMQVLSQTAGGGSNLSVFSNGTFVSSSTRLNFVGATVTDEGGRTKVTITGGSGSGDMLASVYDPQNIADDAFDRANHTGTQTAATISDFDAEVSNNADVAANTSARHAAVTVSDSAEIDFTLTGQQISASIIAGSIDETKLDASVNASLDLADSALQPADVDDTPVNGATTAPVSSNWAFDHEADTSTHGVSGAIVGTTDTQTLTNKRITPRTGTTTSSATPTINTDNVDFFTITAQTVDITSMSTNLSGTPTEGQKLMIWITGTAARAITWGASFANGPVALPTTTVTTTRLHVFFVYDGSVWRCMASGSTV